MCNGQRAIEIKKRVIDDKTVRWIQLSETTRLTLQYANETRAMLRPCHIPMIVQPLPWQQDEVEKGGKVHSGGYIVNHTPLVSSPTKSHKSLMRKHDIRNFLHHLNVESSVPLSPDHYMIDVVQTAWKDGSPHLLEKLDMPPRDYHDMPDRAPEGSTEEEIKARKAERAKTYDKNIAVQSHRQYVSGVMSVVDRMKKYDRLWLPAQADYRTRTYCIPTQMGFQSSKWQRVMLRFAKAIPTSERGKYWLRVHAANCWEHGIEKMAFEDRVAWVDDNMAKIENAAACGLDDDWWMEAENPLPFLAACRALVNDDDGARMAVEMDGSANGLQWFAAMGRDPVAAEAVNLVERSSPSDPYRFVMQKALSLAAGDTNPLATLAASLIDRKLAKNLVMPMSYGQTAYSAREVVYKHLLAKGYIEDRNGYKVLPEQHKPLWDYLDKLMQRAIGQTNAKAKEIMGWLSKCAYAITSHVEGEKEKSRRIPNTNTVRWVTPLGFPVEQWQRQENELRITSLMGEICLKYTHDKMPAVPSRQASSLAPNFVHSYDATHKALWLKAMVDAGSGARHRHDSFGAHAEFMDLSRHHTQRIFRELNEGDPLGNVYAQWRAMYPDADIPEPPTRGSFDLSEIDRATYMFH
jgi:DNA-directed RNA polymerase